MAQALIYLGGNGHCAARLSLARAALARLAARGEIVPFDLIDVPYPGFEGRPRVGDFEAFLASISGSIRAATGALGTSVLYGTGIGGLVALCLRAREEGLGERLLLQAPILWGLERRLMPRLLRRVPMPLSWLFACPWFQRRFVRRQFEKPLMPALREAFFDGYRRCPAASDFFRWLTPGLLRHLERRFAARPEGLRRIGCWWGGRDHVVNLQELAWTAQALGVRWPVRTFAHWGHYPMMDEPEEWVRAVHGLLATAENIPGAFGSEAR